MTLWRLLWRKFAAGGNTKYVDILKEIPEDYDNTKHCSVGYQWRQVKKVNDKIVRKNVYGDHISVNKSSKFKVGDRVRIRKSKRAVFNEGYTPNLTKGIFIFIILAYTNAINLCIKRPKR